MSTRGLDRREYVLTKGYHNLKRSDDTRSVKRCPYDRGGSHSSSVKVAQWGAYLKCPNMNPCSMGSKQKELEVCSQLEN